MASDPLSRLTGELSRLPGVGPKTASRLAHHLLRAPRREAEELCAAILEVKDRLFHCGTCNTITAVDPCRFCSDPLRDRARICVVEQPFNVEPIERTGEYRGLYHVLGGRLSPLEGVGPDELRITTLLARLQNGAQVREVIVATNPSVEGEATALYLQKLIHPLGVRVTRLARGLPAGGDLEYADNSTIAEALAGRRDL